jgi:hypothetical protein
MNNGSWIQDPLPGPLRNRGQQIEGFAIADAFTVFLPQDGLLSLLDLWLSQSF